MSPEDLRLWAYLDNELSELEERQFTEQLQRDAMLRNRYERLCSVRGFLQSDDQPDFDEPMQRTWHRLSLRNLENRPVPWWRRPVPVPLPAMAAAVVLLVLASVAFTQRGDTPRATADHRSEPFSSSFELSAHVGESEQVLQRLTGAGASDEVTIRLPESRTFEFVGQPVIVPSGQKQ